MKKKILSLLLCCLLLVGLLPTVAFATTTYDVWVGGGTQVTSDNAADILGDGTASYDAAKNELTLSGYDGGYIYADTALNIVLADGTENAVSVPVDVEEYGIYTYGDCTISGSGDLNIEVLHPDCDGVWAEDGDLTVDMTGNLTVNAGDDGLYADNDLTVSGSGDITVTAYDDGIVSDGDVSLSGSGDITITAGDEGIVSDVDVTLSGSRNIIITAGYYGISADGNVEINDTCKVSVDASAGSYYAVSLWKSGSKLLLNGTGAPISLKAGTGKAAVWNDVDSNSPVGGTKLSSYTVTGAPDTASVVYTLATNYDLWVDGTRVTSVNKDDVLGDGTASYDAAKNELTLSGYDGSYIKADMALDIVLADGTENTVSVPVDVEEYGIYTYGNCTISGNGDLNIEVLHPAYGGIWAEDVGSLTVDMTGNLTVNAGNDGLYADNDLTVSGSGDITVTTVGGDGFYAASDVTISGSSDITVTAGDDGLYATYGSVTISGSGDITVTAGDDGIVSDGDVSLSGSRNINITAGYYGISADGNVEINDTCKLSVDASAGSYYAVVLWDSGSKLLLNGTGAPISLKSGTGKAAVRNDADSNSPVGGSKLSSYTVTGDPASSKVIYDHTVLTIAGNSYSGTDLLSDIDKVSSEGWKWNASAQELTLSGYNGSYIKAVMALDIVLADGTENTVSVPVDVAEHGIYTYGDCTISGNGSLNIEVLNLGRDGVRAKDGDLTVDMTGDLTVNAGVAGLLAYNDLTISGSGDITVTSGNDGLLAYNDLTVSGSGDITVTTGDYGIMAYFGSVAISGSGNITVTVNGGDGIVADGNVSLSGSRNIITTAIFYGISAGDDVEINDTCKVSASSGSYYAVGLQNSGSKLFLNGTGAPISLTAGEGYKAVWNFADSNSPVGGTNLSYYNRVTGAPNEESVTYDHRSSGGGGGGGGVTTYTLTFNVNGGSSIDKVTKSSGTTVDLSSYIPVRSGYNFAGWYSDAALTTKVTSVKLTKNTTVYAKWTEQKTTAKLPFTDVKEADWSYEDIAYVYEKGLMQGTSATTFSPKVTTSRGMIVTILYRLEGEPAVSGACPFTDVKSGSYYEKAITWAAANGIVGGYGDSKFGPDDPITREQMAAILYRYAGFKGYDVSAKANLNGFTDAGNISAYAKDALAWANAKGLVTGTSATTLSPQGSATREQVAAILHRFCENIVK